MYIFFCLYLLSFVFVFVFCFVFIRFSYSKINCKFYHEFFGLFLFNKNSIDKLWRKKVKIFYDEYNEPVECALHSTISEFCDIILCWCDCKLNSNHYYMLLYDKYDDDNNNNNNNNNKSLSAWFASKLDAYEKLFFFFYIFYLFKLR